MGLRAKLVRLLPPASTDEPSVKRFPLPNVVSPTVAWGGAASAVVGEHGANDAVNELAATNDRDRVHGVNCRR